jgi:biotin operon repressor
MLEANVPAWFEVPTRDLDRATRFYENLLVAWLVRAEMGPMAMAVFPHEKPHFSGPSETEGFLRRSATPRETAWDSSRAHNPGVRGADRLFLIIHNQRGRRAIPARRLADSLSVSLRTVYRDIADLQLSGVPMEGAAGIGYTLRKGGGA